MDRPVGQKALRLTAYLYVAGFAVHGLDHLVRGLDKTPLLVTVVGMAGFFGGLAAVAFVVARHSHRLTAPLAIVVGFVTAVGVAAVHLPGHWGAFSQPFRSDATALDWASVATSVVTALAFGCAGLIALRWYKDAPWR